MGPEQDPPFSEWLTSAENPSVRYLVARDLARPTPGSRTLARLRKDIAAWSPLRQILGLQLDDGSFPYGQKTPTAQPTFWALCLMQLCGMDLSDEPVARAVDNLTERHFSHGVVSYTGGGSGVLPCYVGVLSAALIKMGAIDTELVQSSIDWLVDHQRFDHRSTRAGGDETWPLRAPVNYGCWDSVSCYHGVAGAFRAFASIPPQQRSDRVTARLAEATEYLRTHQLYRRTTDGRPLFRHLTQPFLVGDYRSDLLDMLEAVSEADPELIRQDWVASAVADMGDLADHDRVTLVKNYGRKLADPIPLEPIGAPSRFLSYRWLLTRRTFGLDTPDVTLSE